MEKSLESMFIKQYEALKNQLESANKKIVELQTQKQEEKKEKAEDPVVIKTVSKECCYLEVLSDYNLIDVSYLKALSSNDVKKIISNDEEIRKIAKMVDDHWSYSSGKIVQIRTRAFPYTAIVQGSVILIDVYRVNDECEVNSYILSDKLKQNRYVSLSRKEELYEYGIKCLKKELEGVYKRKLRREQEASQDQPQ